MCQIKTQGGGEFSFFHQLLTTPKVGLYESLRLEDSPSDSPADPLSHWGDFIEALGHCKVKYLALENSFIL